MKRLAAIKLLPAALTTDDAAVKRFQREVQAAAKLSHPNIVQTFDAGVQRGVWYLVMECVEGKDLSALLKKNGPLPIEKAVDYILQAARGLSFAHGEGVVHRDIKPANLLLDKKGVVKILDMGLARFEEAGPALAAADDGLTQSGQVMGTVDYMAPEQAFDTRHADARADVYSLGCSLYRLLTGEVVYPGDTVMQKFLAHRENPIPSLREKRPEVSETLDAVFRKMMAKLPEDRHHPTSQLVADLEACATSLTSKVAANQATSAFVNDGASGRTHATENEDGMTAALGNQLMRSLPDSRVARDDTFNSSSDEHTKGGGRKQKTKAAHGKRPLWKNPLVLSGTGAAVLLMVLLGIWATSRNKEKQPLVKNEAITGDTAKLTSDDGDKKQKNTPIAVAPGKGIPVNSGDPVSLTNYALEFDGRTSRVEIPTLTWDGTPALTIEFWADSRWDKTHPMTMIRLSGNAVAQLHCTGSGDKENGTQWAGLVSQTKAGFPTFVTGKTSPKASDPSSHLALVVSKDHVRFFQNGKMIAETSHKTPQFGGEIGNRTGVGAEFERTKQAWTFHFHGRMDELRVSKSVRYSTDFVPDIRLASDADTLALYHFDEGAGEILHDASGHGHEGKIIDAKWVLADRSAIPSPSTPALNAPTTTTALSAFEVLTSLDYQWSKPENLGPNVNSEANESSPSLTADGLMMIFSSDRNGPQELFECRRRSASEPFGAATPIKSLIANAPISTPWMSADGLTLLFASPKASVGQTDLFISQRTSRDSPWSPGVSLGPNVNTSDRELDASLSPDGLTLYFSGNRDGSINVYSDILSSRRQTLSAPWDLPERLDKAINTGAAERAPRLAADNRTLLFGRDMGKGKTDVRIAEHVSGRDWRVQLLELPFEGEPPHDRALFLAADLRTVFFSSDRPGGRGKEDLWLARRVPKNPNVSVPAAETPPSSSVEPLTDILFLGDGFFQRFPPDLLQAAFPGRTVVNRGIMGNSVAQLTNEVSNGKFADVRPRLIIVEVGFVNDFGRQVRVQPLVGALRAAFPAAMILLNSIPPTKIARQKDARNQELRAEVDDRTTFYLDLDPIFRDPATGAVLPDRIDDTNVTLQAYQEWADVLKPEVERLLATSSSLPATPQDVRPKPWQTPGFQQWMKDVAGMTADKQLVAVSKKLMELNAGFNGELSGFRKAKPQIEEGVVVEVRVVTDHVTDLSPVRALVGLKVLDCSGTSLGKGKLRNLEPLTGMSLNFLNCGWTDVADLTPLKGLPLRKLWCGDTQVADLSPLAGMPLLDLDCHHTKVTDVSALASMATLETLHVQRSAIPAADIMALHKALPTCLIEWLGEGQFLGQPTKLAYLDGAFQQWIADTKKLPADRQVEAVRTRLMELNPGFDGQVTGIGGKGTPKIEDGIVRELGIVSRTIFDISPVRGFPKLTGLDCSGGTSGGIGRLADLSPLRGMALTKLWCGGTAITSLEPLRGMPLTHLWCNFTGVADLSPLLAMPLTELSCTSCKKVADLSPLRGMPLMRFSLQGCINVRDLSPLQDCNRLQSLQAQQVPVTAVQIAELQKALPSCKIEWGDPAKGTAPNNK